MMRLLEKLAALPRAAQWGIYALVFIVAYFGVIEPLMDMRSGWVNRASLARTQVATLEERLADREGSVDVLARATRAHGQAHKPGAFEAERAAIVGAIGRIEQANAITITSLEPRTIAVQASALQAGLEPGDELVRLLYVITFEADPETITSVLRDLEAAPEVQHVGGVRITRKGRGDERTLEARFEPETWAIRNGDGA